MFKLQTDNAAVQKDNICLNVFLNFALQSCFVYFLLLPINILTYIINKIN